MFNAEKLRIYRKASGMTQQALADAAGCDRNTISRVEIGRLRPSHDLVQRIATVLGVSPASLQVREGANLAELARTTEENLHRLSPLERKILNVVQRLGPQAQGEILGLAIARAAGVELDAAVEIVKQSPAGGPFPAESDDVQG